MLNGPKIKHHIFHGRTTTTIPEPLQQGRNGLKLRNNRLKGSLKSLGLDSNMYDRTEDIVLGLMSIQGFLNKCPGFYLLIMML